MKTEINVIVDQLLVEWGVGRMTNREFWTEFAIEAARRAVAARHREYTKVADHRSPTTGSASIADL
jgi:hypothetical protein